MSYCWVSESSFRVCVHVKLFYRIVSYRIVFLIYEVEQCRCFSLRVVDTAIPLVDTNIGKHYAQKT